MKKLFDVFITKRVRVRVRAENKDDAYEVAHNTDDHVSEKVLDETTDEVKPVVT